MRPLLALLGLLWFSEALYAQEAASRIGAAVPYTRYEAEAGQKLGAAKGVGPNRDVGDLGGEASGREAVTLSDKGDGVAWTVKTKTNSLVVRYCVPDSPDGQGSDATLSVYVNGSKKATLDLSSRTSWLYGPEGEPQNTPALGSPRHIYDEAHALLGFTLRPGDVLALKKAGGDDAAFYGIDFVELEMVAPPVPCPPGFVNIADEGVTPENFSERIAPLLQDFAKEEAYKGKLGLYIPPGRYPMKAPVSVPQNGLEVRGAGMWYTQLYDARDSTVGTRAPGFGLNGHAVRFSDFSFWGQGRSRDEGGKPFFGAYGDGATMKRLWIEHTTCGFWVGGDGGVTNHLSIEDCRLRDLGADGINLCNGTKNSRVVGTTVRCSGDDGIALWSAPEKDGPVEGTAYLGCANNVVENCTVELPWRANAYSIYGGRDNTIRNCLARDTLTYAGVLVSSMFKPRPFEGITRVENVVLERCGGAFWSEQQYGALWVMPNDSPVQGITFKDVLISEPTFSGILLRAEPANGLLQPMNVVFENVTVERAGTSGALIQNAKGEATFKSTKLLDSPAPVVVTKGESSLQLNVGGDCVGF